MSIHPIALPHPIGASGAAISASIRTAAALVLKAAGGAGGVMYRMIYEQRVRRAAGELARLDDRMLRDIGISRCEIEYAARQGSPPEVSAGRNAPATERKAAA